MIASTGDGGRRRVDIVPPELAPEDAEEVNRASRRRRPARLAFYGLVTLAIGAAFMLQIANGVCPVP